MPASSLYAGRGSGGCWIVMFSRLTASRSRPLAMRILAIAVSVLALGGWLAPALNRSSAAALADDDDFASAADLPPDAHPPPATTARAATVSVATRTRVRYDRLA